MSILGVNDLVFTKNSKGSINAAGFDINSYLMKSGERAAHVFTDKSKTGGGISGANVSNMFKGLAVPAGLLYLQQNIDKKYPTKSTQEPVSSSLFDRLLEFASEPQKSTQKTRKKKNSSKKKKSADKTKKHTRRSR